MNNTNLLFDFARTLSRRAGEQIRTDMTERFLVSDTAEKGPLAKGDINAHRLVEAALREKFPEHTLFSEEGKQVEIAPHTWICDPICGTYNFLRGTPYFAFSLCYLYERVTRFAIIYNPISDEFFHAIKGEGSFLNGERIHVSPVRELRHAVVDFNVNFSAPNEQHMGVQLFSLLCPPATARLRLTESANLDLAYVACGRYDAYIHPSDKVWDKTAGKLIIEEAGGEVVDFSADRMFTLAARGAIATNGLLTSELLSSLTTVLPH